MCGCFPQCFLCSLVVGPVFTNKSSQSCPMSDGRCSEYVQNHSAAPRAWTAGTGAQCVKLPRMPIASKRKVHASACRSCNNFPPPSSSMPSLGLAASGPAWRPRWLSWSCSPAWHVGQRSVRASGKLCQSLAAAYRGSPLARRFSPCCSAAIHCGTPSATHWRHVVLCQGLLVLHALTGVDEGEIAPCLDARRVPHALWLVGAGDASVKQRLLDLQERGALDWGLGA